MAREKRGKQRAASQEIESSPSFDSEAAPEDSPIGPHARKDEGSSKGASVLLWSWEDNPSRHF